MFKTAGLFMAVSTALAQVFSMTSAFAQSGPELKNTGRTFAAPETLTERLSKTPSDSALRDPLGQFRILALCLPVVETDADIGTDKVRALYATFDWNGFSERDLILIEIRANALQIVMPSGENNFKRVDVEKNGDRIRARANCQSDYQFTLIGKDGTKKQGWSNSVPMEALMAQIDAMPMRQLEMRRRDKY